MRLYLFGPLVERKDANMEIKTLYEFESGGNCLGYYAKGHYAIEDFRAVLFDWIGKSVNVHISLIWWRFIPQEKVKGFFAKADPFSRGAFPVTYAEII